ncbi:lipopolysaccharide biosynthesis protein [Aeromonas caviae]|uniref:lipopolysaccharide biosynthesis protein n=1 Tax=Aeromonas caviae TaxID=648 RepID=UPI000D699AE9|nr:oligosaccharide flippase family protein [Aeromonas caviae]
MIGSFSVLFKRSSVYLLSNILNAVVPFLLIPVLTRYLSPDEYGQVAMFQTLVAGLAALTGLNAVGAANRYYYDAPEATDLADYNGSCLQVLLVSSLLLLLGGLLLSQQLGVWLNIPAPWVLLAVILSGGNFVIQLRLGQWQIRSQAGRFGLFQVSQSGLVFALSLLLVVGVKLGAEGRIAAMMIATVLYVLLSLLSLARDRLFRLAIWRVDLLKDVLKFGVPLVPHVVGIFFLSSIDRFLINDRLGVGEAGIYMLAVQLSLGMVIVFDAINKALVPWLFKALADNQQAQLRRLVRFTYLYFIVVGLLGLLAFWVGPWVVELVAGPDYWRAGSVIGWLCLGQAFVGMYLMVTNYVFYAKRTGRLSVVTITCGVFNIALLLYLMQSQGIVGVAMAFAISMAIRFLATWYLAVKASGFSWCISPVVD